MDVAQIADNDYDAWNARSMMVYNMPLAVMDSTVTLYVNARDKYETMENILNDEQILADLRSIISYYPLLGEVCLIHGTRNVYDRTIDDLDSEQVSQDAQDLLASYNYDTSEAFSRTINDNMGDAHKIQVAIEIATNFFMEDDHTLVSTAYNDLSKSNNSEAYDGSLVQLRQLMQRFKPM